MSADSAGVAPLHHELEAVLNDARHLRQTLAAQSDPDDGADLRQLAIGRLDASVIRPLDAVLSPNVARDLPTSASAGEMSNVDGSLWSLAKRATRLRLRPDSPTQLHEATAALQDLACAAVDGQAAMDARLQQLRDIQAPLPCGIQASTDGPYLVTNAENLRSWLGDGLPSRAQLALCRCGASALKPLCDGSHARVGFSAPRIPTASPIAATATSASR